MTVIMNEDRFFDLLQQELDGLRTDMQFGFKGINDRLDALNGRVRKHGEQIAVLESQVHATDGVMAKSSNAHDEIKRDVTAIKQFCALQHSVKQEKDWQNSVAILTGQGSMRLLAGVGIGSGATVIVIWQIVSWLKGIL